jgi:hypothetical protein
LRIILVCTKRSNNLRSAQIPIHHVYAIDILVTHKVRIFIHVVSLIGYNHDLGGIRHTVGKSEEVIRSGYYGIMTEQIGNANNCAHLDIHFAIDDVLSEISG